MRNADAVAVAHLSDGASGPGLGGNVADTRARGDAREASIGDQGDVFAPGEVLQRDRELCGFGHATAEGPDSDQNDHVAFPDAVGSGRLHRGDGGGLGGEDTGGPSCR